MDLSVLFFFFFQAEDGIRDLVRSRGLGDVYKRQFHWVPLVTTCTAPVCFCSIMRSKTRWGSRATNGSLSLIHI